VPGEFKRRNGNRTLIRLVRKSSAFGPVFDWSSGHAVILDGTMPKSVTLREIIFKLAKPLSAAQ